MKPPTKPRRKAENDELDDELERLAGDVSKKSKTSELRDKLTQAHMQSKY